jgi:peptidoglycan hydrolase-like protein with peptidoglycan-binding domain
MPTTTLQPARSLARLRRRPATADLAAPSSGGEGWLVPLILPEPGHRRDPNASRTLAPLGHGAARLQHAAVLQLQRTHGNQAVQRWLEPSRVQRCGGASHAGCPCAEEERPPIAARQPLVQRTLGDGHDLTSPRFAGEPQLEACYDDEARLTVGAGGPAVVKVQQALVDRGYDLGPDAGSGRYGAPTWNAVKSFKADEHLGWEHMGDVGPGTMRRLNELFAAPGPTPPGPLPGPRPGPAPDPTPQPPCPESTEDMPNEPVTVLGLHRGDGAVPETSWQRPRVHRLQELLLKHLPDAGLDLNCRFDPKTEAALVRFQEMLEDTVEGTQQAGGTPSGRAASAGTPVGAGLGLVKGVVDWSTARALCSLFPRPWLHSSCDDNARRKINTAHAIAVGWLSKTLNALVIRPLTKAVEDALWIQFQTTKVADADKVQTKLAEALKVLTHVSFYCPIANPLWGCTPGNSAFVSGSVTGSAEINVCAEGLAHTDEELATTIIHEAAHLVGIDKKPELYALPTCLMPERLSTSAALMQAESYACFAWYVARADEPTRTERKKNLRGENLEMKASPSNMIKLRGPRLNIRQPVIVVKPNPTGSGFTYRWTLRGDDNQLYRVWKLDPDKPGYLSDTDETKTSGVSIPAITRLAFLKHGVRKATLTCVVSIPDVGQKNFTLSLRCNPYSNT